MEGYTNLANAIAVNAAKDWRNAVKELKRSPDDFPSIKMKKDCEQFFLSKWFTALTAVDGTYILRKLREEAGYDR